MSHPPWAPAPPVGVAPGALMTGLATPPATGTVFRPEPRRPAPVTPAPPIRHRAGAALQWAVVGLAGLAAVTMLWWPLGHDQGIFALNGATVAAGGLPYRDAFETRGPLAFYLYAALRLLFGPTAWGVRVFDVAVVLLGAALVYRVVTTVGSRPAARLAAAGWVLAVVSLGHQDTAQFELWIGVAVLGGLLRVVRPGGYRTRDLVAFGGIVGLASLTKQFYPILLAVAGAVVLVRRRSNVRMIARDAGLLFLGWAAPVAAALAWFAAQGTLPDLWEAHMTYTLTVYPAYVGDSQGRVLSVLGFLLRGAIVPTTLAAAGVGVALLWRECRDLALALLTWLACGLFMVVLQGRFFPYHWAVLYPALAVLAGVGCAYAARRVDAGRWFGVVVGAAILAQTALTPLGGVRHWMALLTGRESAAAYYARFSVWLTNPAEEQAAARYLHARTRPGQPVGMWAVDAAVPFLADRPLAGRISERRGLTLAPWHPLTQRYRREFLRDVASDRPPYFVVNLRVDAHERPLAQDFPELNALVTQRYVHDSTFGALEVLRLRSGALPPSVQRPR